MSDVIARYEDPGIAPAETKPDPMEIEPRSCELCGLTIDRHEMVDDGDGPVFYCFELSPSMTLPELERRAELRRQQEVAEILARLEAMDRPAEIPAADKPRPYRTTADSTVAAFKYVLSLNDPERLKGWLAEHPKDAPTLLELLGK
jgi:hypothetical protein